MSFWFLQIFQKNQRKFFQDLCPKNSLVFWKIWNYLTLTFADLEVTNNSEIHVSQFFMHTILSIAGVKFLLYWLIDWIELNLNVTLLRSTFSNCVFLFFSHCTDVLAELWQPLAALRDGWSPRSATFPRKAAQLHGGEGHRHHTVSNHIEKSSRSLSSIPVHKGTGRIFGG